MATATSEVQTVEKVTLVLDGEEAQALRNLVCSVGGFSEFRLLMDGIGKALTEAGFDLDMKLYHSDEWPLRDNDGRRIMIHPRGGTAETYTEARISRGLVLC